MKYLLPLLCLSAVFTLSPLTAREYGGRWDEESIREFSLKYIEGTKERFAKRAARVKEILKDHPSTVEYRQLTEPQQEAWGRFLNDRLGSSDRDALLELILKDLEEARLKLVESEKLASEAWKKLPKEVQKAKTEAIKAEIYGTEVTASNLGVVLDNSPSMQPYLEPVRAEISKSFPNAHYKEAAGSGIEFDSNYRNGNLLNDSWYYNEAPGAGENPFDPKWHQQEISPHQKAHYRQVGLERNPASALLALIALQKVDTIYWFCDFEDENDARSVKIIADAIKEQNVKLYVHSSKRRPKKEIMEIIEASGGEVIRKRIR